MSEVKFADLKDMVKELNESGLLEEKIKFVAVKKDDLAEDFCLAVENLDDKGKADEIPEAVKKFYEDAFCSDDDETSSDEPVEEKKKKKAKTSKKAEKPVEEALIPEVVEEKPLTKKELKTLGSLEKKIEKGLNTFYEVGSALVKIRESRLYRDDYLNFNDYCMSRWNFTRRYADNLIASSSVVDNLSEENVTPVNEAQTRPLANFNPADQKKIWRNAVKSAKKDPLTAKIVDEEAKKFKAKINKGKTAPVREILIGDDFKEAVSDLMRLISIAKSDDWEGDTNKAGALQSVRDLMDEIRKKD